LVVRFSECVSVEEQNRLFGAVTRKIVEANRIGRSELCVGRICRHTQSVVRSVDKNQLGGVQNGSFGALSR
jgi:hypothetical protein